MAGKGLVRSLPRRLSVAVGILLIAHAPFNAATAAEPETISGPKQQFQKLVQEFETARQEFSKAYQAATTDAERQKAAANYPRPQTYAGRFLKVARENPNDPVAEDALVWVVVNARLGTEAEAALTILRRDHLASEKLASVCQSLVYSPWSQREEFLRDVAAKNPHPAVQGQASYALALVVKDRAPADAEKLLNDVAAKFADVKSYRGTLGDAAKSELYEIRNLAVGKAAPEIQGEDSAGKKFKLSDYRGKVVMLDFWGDW